MQSKSKKRPQQSVVYITRDLERALPLVGKKGHFIVTNSTPFAIKIAKKNKGLFLISENKLLDTRELLENKKTDDFLRSLGKINILVFKNTPLIERICTKNGWKLLNPEATLSAKIEEKISQVEWLGEVASFLPPHEIIKGSDLKYSGKKLIVQFNRAHTGLGTILVDSPEAVLEIAKKFPNRPLRKTDFINGPVLTSNNLVFGSKIITGSPSYQITGLSPFTNNHFATVGNDWSLPKKILSKKNLLNLKKIARAVGERLAKDRWAGLFGIDAILDEKTGKIFLLEINARQPASTSFESALQKKWEGSTFELHLAALLNNKPKTALVPVTNGAQIILRNPEKNVRIDVIKIEKYLNKFGFSTITYLNREPGSDLLRIMSKKGIMSAHNKFNTTGLLIKKIIENYG